MIRVIFKAFVIGADYSHPTSTEYLWCDGLNQTTAEGVVMVEIKRGEEVVAVVRQQDIERADVVSD